MIKKALIIVLLAFCWMASEVVAESTIKSECSLQVKNFSGQTVDV